MPQVLVNPYTPQTAIGAGLQNIALALFGQRQKENQRAGLNAQQGDLYAAHGDLYREQTRKASVERQLAERLLRDQGADSQDELIAARSGVPVYTVRGYRDALAGRPVPGASLDDYKDMAPSISRAMLAVRPAYADKTINPVNIAQALDSLERTDTRNDVIAGKQDAKAVARAFFATSGHAPYAGSETGSTDLTTGDQTLNPIGTGRAERERATAFEHNQRGRVAQTEADSGVRVGAPVVIDSEAGPVYAPPRAAAGQRPGLNPNSAAARQPAGRGAAGGDATTTTELKPLKIGNQDSNLLLGGIDRAVGGQLGDQQLTGAILSRAQEYYATPGSPHYGAHESAARAAVQDIMPEGSYQPMYRFGQSGYAPKGAPNMNPGPIAATGAKTTSKVVSKGGGGSPAAARPAAAQGAYYISPSGKRYSDADVQFTASKRGMTVDQVIQQLKLTPGA